jgi:hypothetical protein
MQRLGYLKILVAIADSLGSTTLQGLTTRFEAAVTAKHRVPDHVLPRAIDYVTEQKLPRYPNLRSRRHEARGSPSPVIEIQDLYLSDPALTASSGAMTGDQERKGYRHAVYVEMPPWAISLGLLRRDNYSVTDRGRALLSLAPRTMEQFRAFDTEANPFLLDQAERVLFLYALVDADGDLLRCTYQRVLGKTGSFSRSEVGDQIAEALLELRRDSLKRPSSAQELAMIQKMEKVELSVRNQSGSGMGPRESVATPRTEPLVDCGVLSKTSRNAYVYECTEGGRRFLERLIRADSATEFIENGLATAAADMFGIATRKMPSDEILARVAKSYARLRKGLGYMSLREVTALSVAEAIRDGAPGFELRDAEEVVLRAGGTYGHKVRFTRGRTPGAVQFRFDKRLVEELACTDQ